FFFFSSRRRHTRSKRDWSSDVCSSDLLGLNIVKMVFALLLILALIYTLLCFLKKRRSYEKAGSLENIGGISVGQQKSVQIIRIEIGRASCRERVSIWGIVGYGNR